MLTDHAFRRPRGLAAPLACLLFSACSSNEVADAIGAGAGGSASTQGGASGASGASAGSGGEGAEPSAFVGGGCDDSAFFCEDFEGLSLGDAEASNGWLPQGLASIDSEAAEGERSLRLQPAGGAVARIVLDGIEPPNNDFYGRVRVRVAEYPSAPNFAHYVFVEVVGSGSAERLRPVGGQLIQSVGLNMWGPGADGGPTGDWTNWQPSAPTRDDVWECVEWHMAADGPRMDVWIDERFQPDLSSDGNPNNPSVPLVFPQFETIWFGFWLFQGGTVPAQFDVRLDDIVLSSERVGCD